MGDAVGAATAKGSDLVDPVTLEVVRNRFDLIAEEMEVTLLKTSRSTIIKEALDASAAIFDAQGRTMAQANSIPAHLGMLVPAVRTLLESFPPDAMQPGDVYVMNDPYDGGTHLPDVTVLGPVFFEGRVVALACTMAHHQDIGGKTPGSTPPDAPELYAEGLVIPPLKLRDRGEPNHTLEALIRRNVRIPDMFLGDLEAQLAAVATASRRLHELFMEYGEAVLARCVEQLMDYGERLTRAVISRIPDGDYTFADYLDDDGVTPHTPQKIQATIRVRGDHLVVDWTGTCPQLRGAMNCVPASTNAMVYYAVKALAGPGIPNNDGYQRCVSVVAPEGTLVNPQRPAAVGARTISAKRLVSVLLGALVKALPDAMPAASDGQANLIYVGGAHPRDGRRFVTMLGVPTAGALGARPAKDGIDVVETDMNNLLNVPVEAFEMEYPNFRIEHVRLWQDSGGAGRRRGGLGYHAVCRLLEGEVTVTHRRDRHDTAPWGLFGGQAAPRCSTILARADGTRQALPSKVIFSMAAGDALEIYTSGGGGHGDPLEREPPLVRDDVLDGRVSPGAAYDLYGVALRDGAVDEAATQRRRAELQAARGPITWTYDRGEGFEERVRGQRFER